MTASLPMYDWPEIRTATDAWWRGLGRALRAEGVEDVPDRLLHDVEVAGLWGAPNLLLSQTCGYPLTHEWAGKLQVVAIPNYDAEGCNEADYCSFILVRKDAGFSEPQALHGRVAAFNGTDSQSGYSALRAVFAPFAEQGRFFGAAVTSGAHLRSIEMVAAGDADVCAVDAVVWALARRHCPGLTDHLTAIAVSPAAPGLPYVTSPMADQERLARLRAGLQAAFADPTLSDVRAELLLCGVTVPALQAYDRIIEIERDSIARGYPTVR